jgi:phosphoribosylformylglycinamidine cyclo-ligase
MSGLTYKDAGVDIDAADALVADIRALAQRTARPELMGGIGGFSGLFRVPSGYREPVLSASTDGVGTKLRLAIAADRHEVVGIDVVAMCVNDLVCCGAEPLFFLDYLATGRLDAAVLHRVLAGIVDGCEQCGAALLGGETAEMPGFYAGGEYDVAGFAVGVVERSEILDGARVAAGDLLIALASSGPHANGFSLVRRVLGEDPSRFDADAVLAPTRIYVRAVRAAIAGGGVRAAAHITGGGLSGNLVRVLPEGARAVVDRSTWTVPAVFRDIQARGGIADDELDRTFNCGVGMVLVVAEGAVEAVLSALSGAGEHAWVLGRVAAGERGVVFAESAA